MASIKEVAKDAGVSIATVSYVLNKSKYVSPELTKKVLYSVKKLNYNINPMASCLRNKTTSTIGVVLQNIRNPFFPLLLAGLETQARRNDYRLMFFNSYNDLDVEKQAVLTFSNMWVDGIIIDSCVKESEKAEYIEFLRANDPGKNIPVVFLERSLDNQKSSAVITNNFDCGYVATHHLIQMGRKNIIFISGPNDWSMVADRKFGYLKAIEESGLQSKQIITADDFSANSAYKIIKQILSEGGNHIDGIFAMNDQIALGSIKAIKDLGLNIPSDIAVVGFDNIQLSSMITPSLTTIDVPRYLMGKTAVELLVGHINDETKQAQTVILPSQIVIRHSTDQKIEDRWDFEDLF